MKRERETDRDNSPVGSREDETGANGAKSTWRGFRDRFGLASLVLATTALVVVLAGAAVAASGAFTNKQKREVKSIATSVAKSFQGTGPAGPQGAPGRDGINGAPGAPGAPGHNLIATPEAPGQNCAEGGSGFEVEGSGQKHYACSGAEGEEGPEGSPWTAEGTLPPGATETGTYSFNGTTADEGGAYAPISFPIPLAESIDSPAHVHYVEREDKSGPCKGDATGPEAPPGELCVYEGFLEGATPPLILNAFASTIGASVNGALLLSTITGSLGSGGGGWAVTGCSPTLGDPNVCP